MDRIQTCMNCEEEFTVVTRDEEVKAGYCPFCGDIMEEEDEEDDLITDEWDDQNHSEF